MLAAAVVGSAAVIAMPTIDEATAQEQDARSAFTLAVLPDTQFYSRYAGSNFEPDYGTNPFAVQTEWLAEHAEALNIPFATHVGDVVDVVGQEDGWRVADEAMTTLEDAGVPYAVVPGNHDVRNSSNSVVDTDYDLEDEPYLATFPAERSAADATFRGADPTGLNRFHIFEAEGQEYLVLSLSWRVSDATIDWANDVLDSNPGIPTIVLSHDIIGVQNDGVTGVTSDNGERLWNGLIDQNDQIFLTLNGHFHGSTHITRENAAGSTVTQVLMDHQMAYEGGNGYLGLLEFDLTNDRINVNTVSPWVVSKSHDRLTSYDVPVLTGANEQYSIEIDFESRFDDFATVAPSHSDLSTRALEIITGGFPGVPESPLAEAGNSEDYVRAPGTLAHWQLGGESGVVEEGAVFADLAGDSDLHRVSIADSGSSTAEVEDVTVAEGSQLYAPSQQAVCFANSDREADRFSYLTTAADAAVNDADLSNGYTIETMVYIDESWSADANQWSKILVRTGNRSEIPGMPWSQWDYTASPASLGISNLREFQWTEVGADATRGDKTNWSGEILPGTWSHVVLVNDPVAEETVMYVNGAPVLRTAQDTYGMSFNEGMPWILGADWVDDAAGNGWNGCIGETRIIDRPTAQDQWLTARPDLSVLTASVVVEDETVIVSGEGVIAADVRVLPDEEAAVAPSGAVSDDGVWRLEIDIASLRRYAAADGSVTLYAEQGFGDRVSDVLPVEVMLPTDDGGTDPTEPDPSEPGTTDPSETDPSDPAQTDRDASNDDGTDGLPRTGTTLSLLLIAAALVLLVAGFVMIRRRTARV